MLNFLKTQVLHEENMQEIKKISHMMKPITHEMQRKSGILKKISHVMEPVTHEMQRKNGVLKKISHVMKPVTHVMKSVTCEIFFISCMFFL